jgi:alkylation response protein AidB-like acyl-CoA dehydrogenase
MNGSAANASAEELELLSDSVRDFCTRSLGLPRLRELRERAQSCDRDAWSQMSELGWIDAVLPADLDGMALGAGGVVRIARELGRSLSPEPFLETAVAAASLLAAVAPHDARLARARAGNFVLVAPAQSAAWRATCPVTARTNGDTCVLNGRLQNIALVDQADGLLVPARLNGQIALFALALGDCRKNEYRLADGSFAGDIRFDDERVSRAGHLVSEVVPDMAITNMLALLGIGASAYLQGLAEALFEMTLDHVRTRHQFGRPIGSFQALQHRLVDCYLHNRLAGAAIGEVITHSPGDALSGAARARERACAAARRSAREAIQMHGAIGYTAEHDVALYVWRMLVMTARYGGGLDEIKAAGAPAYTDTTADGVQTAVVASDDELPPGTHWNTLDDEQFRTLVRTWLGENYPPQLRHLPYQVRWSEIREWHGRLLDRGWAAPAWPPEHGGMGLSAAKLLIYIEEFERHGVARTPDQGIVMFGPILFQYGTAAQREKFLAKALTGEHIWCQGYSEPNAGSDLASLSTRAELVGEEFIVNGQKTWTTHALDATHMYCLVRTDRDVKPQAGISFLLIDLDQPGVDIRPITNLGGHVDFCEVFLDDVRVPKENLVGELNQGWSIAKALLGHERLFVGSPKLCQHALNQLRSLAERLQRFDDPVFVDAFARAALDVDDLVALYAEFAGRAKAGQDLGVDVALLKIWSTETYAALSEMIVDASGDVAARIGESPDTGVDALAHYYNARPAPIYAGSNEIQRNIVAKHVLGLPS